MKWVNDIDCREGTRGEGSKQIALIDRLKARLTTIVPPRSKLFEAFLHNALSA